MLTDFAAQFPTTDLWLDSMVEEDIRFALSHGSKGITTAPSITRASLEAERDVWAPVLLSQMERQPAATERRLLWSAMYELAGQRAKAVLPLYDANGTSGRFAIQVDIYHYNDTKAMIEQARHIHTLGNNFFVKIPTTAAGLIAMEEIVAEGHSVMATSCASVSQVSAAVEALERGYDRCVKAGRSTEGLSLACAMQLGFQDACIHNYAAQHGLSLSCGAQQYGAVAVGKKAYELIRRKGSRVRFVLSNFTEDLHWTEFVGGDLIMTMPMRWQTKLEAISSYQPRIDAAVDEQIIQELTDKIPHFAKEYQENALSPEEFLTFPTVSRIINAFLVSYHKALLMTRSIILPDPCGSEAPFVY